jgi:2-haloacid dehalogenase
MPGELMPGELKRVAAVIFDAYGTLLDVHSAMARHAGRLGERWVRLSQDWRVKQLEYSWVRTLAGPAQHVDFARLTDDALAFVAARHDVTDPELLADLRAAYRSLDAYPEAADALRALQAGGVARAILSNGEPQMLAEGVAAAGLEGLLDDVLSVEAVGVYKPDPRVYRLAEQRFGAAASDMAFVSSNAWDAFGALSAGFRVFWINRAGQPDEYRLGSRASELPNLSALPAHLLA